MTVTASLQWICGLSFAWLVATAGAANLALEGSEGSLFHLLNRFHYRMIDGLAWPLYGIAAARPSSSASWCWRRDPGPAGA